jgi:hypothetical protein
MNDTPISLDYKSSKEQNAPLPGETRVQISYWESFKLILLVLLCLLFNVGYPNDHRTGTTKATF